MKEVKIIDFMEQQNKRQIFHENDQKFKEMDARDKKIGKIKKLVFYSGAVIALSSSLVLIKHQAKYLDQPVQIITHDIMSNEGIKMTDDGKTVDPKKFGSDEKDEMYEYARKHGVTKEELKAQIIKQLEKEGLATDLIMERLKQDYPGLLGETPVMRVYPVTEGKAR